jgi:DNA invertase Pin-like site-specific DNA recombinase
MIEQVKKVAIYARVSTEGQSVSLQVTDLREYVVRRGWRLHGEYLDEGVSGSRESRPALNRLMNDAKQRKVDILLVWKIDRFGRSLKHLVNSLAELESSGVAFVSFRDSLDLSSPAGRLMAQLLGAISEFERSLITERVRAGIRNAKTKGKRLGRPPLTLDSGRNRQAAGFWSLSACDFGATGRQPRQRPPCASGAFQ